MASSPMKKSRSSIPRLDATFELAEVLRNEGFEATEGPADGPAAPPVAMAVGWMNEGSLFPAKPILVKL